MASGRPKAKIAKRFARGGWLPEARTAATATSGSAVAATALLEAAA